MKPENLALTFAVLSLIAAACALVVVTSPPTPTPPVMDVAEYQTLRQTQDLLVHDLKQLSKKLDQPRMVSNEPARTVERDPQMEALVTKLDRVLTRLDKIEQTQAALATYRKTNNLAGIPILADILQQRGDAPRRLTPEERKKQLQQYRKQATNASLTEKERLQALGRLRGMGKGARSGDVAQAMIKLAQESQDPGVRADVWRQMHRAQDKALIDPMIHSLLYDKNQKVREEAAESLGFYLDEPRVKAALEQASRGDRERAVQKEAERSLEGRNR